MAGDGDGHGDAGSSDRPFFNLRAEGGTPEEIMRKRKGAQQVAKRYGRLVIDGEACMAWGPVANSLKEIDGDKFDVANERARQVG